MTVELDQAMLIDLVKGTFPHFDLFEERIIGHCGAYSDNSGWHWYDANLKLYSEQELLDLYKMCKKSWKR